MTKIDLITGFLGSGKTTFLRLYANYLISRGENIAILENDYGAVNVDMMLLGDLQGDKCELEMVSASCHMDCHKRRFKTKLISMGMCGYDRVIVEPSGIFDVDEFFDNLTEEPLNHMYEIDNVIAIVNASLENDLSKESDFYLASQIANSGAILLSRAQLASDTQISETVSHLESAAKSFGLSKDIRSILNYGNWFDFTDKDFEAIKNSGYQISSYIKTIAGAGSSYSSVYFLDYTTTKASIEASINTLFNTPSCGDVFRLKGFFEENGKWYEVNATKNETVIKELTLGQSVIIVIGENLNRKEIEAVMNASAV